MTEKPNPTGQSSNGGAAAPHQAAAGINASEMASIYANFCRVTGTPEEVIIDFALSTDPTQWDKHSVKAAERVILSFFTAKRLLEALHLTVSRHEAAFGNLELNAEKRTVPGWRG